MKTNMFADQHVFNGGHIRKQTDVLKRASNTQRGDLKRLKFSNFMTVEDDLTASDRIDAGHSIEESCLACSIWTDQTRDHSFFDNEINIIYGNESSECLGDFTSFKEIHSLPPIIPGCRFQWQGRLLRQPRVRFLQHAALH